jgi:uncharacterized protein YneR
MKVVVYGGELGLNAEAFITRLQKERPKEITTNEDLDGLSVAYFEADNMNHTNGQFHDIEGMKHNQITVVSAESLIKAGATIKQNKLPDYPSHALLSGISAKVCFKIFDAGVHIDKSEYR